MSYLATEKINGRDAIIIHRSSTSHQKDKPKFNQNTLKVIDALLLGSENSFIYNEGIITLSTFNDRDEGRLDINRVANSILELRKVIPHGWLITFRYVGDKKSKYGLEKKKRAIKFVENLKASIEAKINS
jgi:hypothetical protein